MSWQPSYAKLLKALGSGTDSAISLAVPLRRQTLRRLSRSRFEPTALDEVAFRGAREGVLNMRTLENLAAMPPLDEDETRSLEKIWEQKPFPEAIAIAVATLDNELTRSKLTNLLQFSEARRIYIIAFAMQRRMMVFQQNDYTRLISVLEKSFDLIAEILDESKNNYHHENVRIVKNVVNIGYLYSYEGSLKALNAKKGVIIRQLAIDELGYNPPNIEPAAKKEGQLVLVLNSNEDTTEHLSFVKYAKALSRYVGDIKIAYLSHNGSKTLVENSLSELGESFNLSNQSLAEQFEFLRSYEFSIAFFANNLSFGYARPVALASLRIARKQITNYASVVTTGIENVDVFLSGKDSEPRYCHSQYRERLILFPGSGLRFAGIANKISAWRKIASARKLRKSQHIRFITGANLYKCSPAFIDTAMQILNLCSKARFIMYPFNPNWKADYPAENLFKARIRAAAVKHGVEPHRIIFLRPHVDPGDIFKQLSQSDVYLDSFPHSGGLSTLDAVISGLPVITMEGKNQRGLQGADVLRSADFVPGASAHSHMEYVEAACMFASQAFKRRHDNVEGIHAKLSEIFETSIELSEEVAVQIL